MGAWAVVYFAYVTWKAVMCENDLYRLIDGTARAEGIPAPIPRPPHVLRYMYAAALGCLRVAQSHYTEGRRLLDGAGLRTSSSHAQRLIAARRETPGFRLMNRGSPVSK